MTIECSCAGPVSPAARRFPTIAGMRSGSDVERGNPRHGPGKQIGRVVRQTVERARDGASAARAGGESRPPPPGRPPRSESWPLRPWDRPAARCARPSATAGSAAPPWSRAAAPVHRPRARRGGAARRRRCRCPRPSAARQAVPARRTTNTRSGESASTSAVTPRDASASTSAFLTTPRSWSGEDSKSEEGPTSTEKRRFLVPGAYRPTTAPAGDRRRAARGAPRRSSRDPMRFATTCGDGRPRPTRRVRRRDTAASLLPRASVFRRARRTASASRGA